MNWKDEYLAETYFFDFKTDVFQNHLKRAIQNKETNHEKLIAWYLYVRDTWAYNPYNIYIEKEHYKASEIVKRDQGHCIDKSIIFITGLRSMGIPSRIHLAKVKNHISAEKIIEKFGTDELAPHGYAGVYFNEKWTKASPIFDQKLCARLNVDTLFYDGSKDSIFQEFDKKGNNFMEYLEEYGHFTDLNLPRIKEIMVKVYGNYAQQAMNQLENGMLNLS